MNNKTNGGKKMKKILFNLFSILFVVASVFALESKVADAAESDVVSNLEEVSSGNPEQVVQSNIGSTTFSPESSEGEFQTFGLSFARGTISCMVMGNDAFCPWTIQIGGDVFSYSNVKVTLYRDEGFLNGGYEVYATSSFNHRVIDGGSYLRNEAQWRLPKGHYKAYLGGTFTTVKNGVYSAVASNPAVFEIK